MQWIDSHAHLTLDEMYPFLEEVMQRAKEQGFVAIVNICTTLLSLSRGLETRKSYPWIYNAAAVTPHDVNKEDSYFEHVTQAAKDGQLIAIGETGLDYHYNFAPAQKQQAFLREHLRLASRTHLPVIFHCREAFKDLFNIWDDNPGVSKALLHCFTGTLEEARGCLDRGWFISISGIVTFKKSHLLREVAKYVPLDALVIETDAPYLAPQSKRGRVNEPAFMIETAEVIADVKRLSLEDVSQATTQNSIQFFSFPKKESHV